MNPANVSVDEALAFLDRFPEVEAVDLILYDGNGVGRGKIIRRAELVHVFEQGVSLPASILGQEVCGEDVDATGLVWDRGDGDMRAWPVSGTLKLVHGSSPQRGEILISLYDLDGSPMSSDPRHVLQRQIDRLSDKGLRAAAAFELEFFYWITSAMPLVPCDPRAMCSMAVPLRRLTSTRWKSCRGCCRFSMKFTRPPRQPRFL